MKMNNTGLKPHTNNLDRKAKWLLVGIILLAILLRAWGIDFGLPYIYHPDESVGVTIAQNMIKTGDLNPHFFHYPSLFFYIHSLAYGPYYLTGKLAGVFHSPADIPAPGLIAMGSGLASMPSTFLLGRIVTAAFGTATVALVFLIGWHLTNDKTIGLLAALMTAISPANVSHSRYITPDTLAVFFMLLSFWGSVRVYKQGKTRHYIVAGIAVGLAASAKYNGALIALGLVSAHFLRYRLKGFREHNLYLAFALSAIAFVITTPFAILDYQEFWAAVQFDARHYATGHAGMEGNTLSWYLTYLWRVEGPVALLAVLGILWGARARLGQIVLLSAFPLTYFVFINRFAVRNDRTLLPLIPFLFLLASSLLVDLHKRAQTNRWKLLTTVISVMTIVSLAFPLLETAKRGIRITTVDSRETARVWIAENLPSGARVAVESYAPYVDPHRFSVQGFNGLTDHTAEWYILDNFEYLVFSEGAFGRFFKDPNRYSKQVSQYQDLLRAFDMVRIFTDGDYEVRIYRITE